MFLLLFTSVLAFAQCDDILYYGAAIEHVVRTGRTSVGLTNDQTDFQGYLDTFGREFAAAVRNLRRDDTWINFGAGAGRAERDVIEGRVPSGGPRVVSVSAHRPADAVDSPPRHLFFSGQLIEEMDWADVPKAELGSDRFGPLSYARQFDRALEIEGEALASGAPLFVVLQTRRTYLFEHGRPLTIEDYLKRVEGLRLDGPIRFAAGRQHLMTFVLRRTERAVRAPALRLRSLKFQLPPLRVYDL